MTVRQSWEFVLIECNKLKAPSILLEDYIYLFNKAIQQYINSVYNRAEYNQQSSDDLGFLQTTTTIEFNDDSKHVVEFGDNVWTLSLPKDYLHILNCIAEFSGNSYISSKCGDSGIQTITSPCNRLTADLYPGVLNNYYMRPSHKKPYYYVINNNDNKDKLLPGTNIIPTNYSKDSEIRNGSYNPDKVEGSSEEDNRGKDFLKEQYDRTANQSIINIQIHSGSSNWRLNKIYVTYLKAPMYVSMTQNQLLAMEDETQKLEFPDYICYEIINICVRLLLENASDPRLQTNIPINQTIAVPGNN